MQFASSWRRFPSVMALLGLCLASGCAGTSTSTSSGPMVGADTPVVGFQEAEKAGLKNRWLCLVPLARSRGEKIVNLWRLGDNLYVITSDNVLYSVNGKTGTMNWSHPADLGSQHSEFYPPQEVAGGTSLLLMNQTYALLVSKRDGMVTKRATLGFAATTDPLVIGTDIVVGSAGGYFYGLFDDLLGKRDWAVWSRNDSFQSNPALVLGRVVVFASRSGLLWAVRGRNGEAIWKDRKVNGQVIGGLVSDDTLVYIPCLDNKVYAFDVLDGGHIWDTHVEGTLDQTPVLRSKMVLVVGTGNGLTALSTAKGDVKWKVPGIQAVVANSGDKIYASDKAGTLYQIAPDTGAVLHTQPVAYVSKYLKNTVDSDVVVITQDGRLAAFEEVK